MFITVYYNFLLKFSDNLCKMQMKNLYNKNKPPRLSTERVFYILSLISILFINIPSCVNPEN